jgi:hypothetical protein
MNNELNKIPYETILELYIDYRNSNIWNPPAPFTHTFDYVVYGVNLKRELQRRDKKKGSMIL